MSRRCVYTHFVARLRVREPEQCDRLNFAPGEEMPVDYGEGAPTLVPGNDRYRKPRLVVATLRYSRRSFRRVVRKSSSQVWEGFYARAGLEVLRRSLPLRGAARHGYQS